MPSRRPNVADIDGDGLLTLDEILALKINADWVVLSACNTATGDGAGAEAVSGLGRAFFYAGTRALLVSNWPVETTSARALTTNLFRRQAQAAIPHPSRGAATDRTGVDRGRRLCGSREQGDRVLVRPSYLLGPLQPGRRRRRLIAYFVSSGVTASHGSGGGAASQRRARSQSARAGPSTEAMVSSNFTAAPKRSARYSASAEA